MKKLLGRIMLAISGWRIEGGVPEVKKLVMIAAPHTSNWDFVHMTAIAFFLDIDISWMGKRSLFRFPFGTFFRVLGGIPVDRSKNNNLVEQLVAEMDKRERFFLVVPAEGTRRRSEYWKSGFYHIAYGAGVPIALGYLDFSKKCGSIGPLLYPTGDIAADMDRIRAHYADIKGKHPERFTTPRLREEDEQKLAATG